MRFSKDAIYQINSKMGRSNVGSTITFSDEEVQILFRCTGLLLDLCDMFEGLIDKED